MIYFFLSRIKASQLIWLFFLCIIIKGKAQLSKPIITNYKNNHFQINFKVHDIEQSIDGVMYFATTKGLVTYNGTSWSKISEVSGIPFTDISKFEHDIFLSGKEFFGILSKSGTNHYEYQSLSDSVREFAYQNVTANYSLHLHEKSYFIGNHLVVTENNRILDVLAIPGESNTGTIFDKKVLIHVPKEGVFALHKDKDWVFTPISSQNTNIKILKGTESYLFVVLDDGTVEIYNSSYKKVKSYRTHKKIQAIEFLSEQYLALATDEGILIYDVYSLQYVLSLDETLTLESNQCISLKIDKQFNLWIGTQRGISKAEIFLPFSFYSEESGVHGSVNDVLIQQNELLVATNLGIYKKTGQDSLHQNLLFTKIYENIQPVSDIEWINQTFIFLSANNLYYINAKQEPEKLFVFDQDILKIKKMNNSEFFIHGLEGLYFMRQCKELECSIYPWFTKKILDIPIQDLVIIDTSTILYISHKKLYSVEYQNSNFQIIKDSGFVNIANVEKLYQVDGNIFALKKNNIVKIEKKGNKFEETPFFFIQSIPKNYDHSYLIKTNLHYYLIFSSSKNAPIAYYKSIDSENKHFIPLTLFRRLPSFQINNLIPDPNKRGYFWVSTENGLIEFKSFMEPGKEGDFETSIEHIFFNNHVLEFVNPEVKVEFPYYQNSVTFQYTSTNYIAEDLNEYSYFLEGSDKEWSAWSPENKVTYASLPGGKYTFKVKSKNLYQQESEIAEFSFYIKYPWYQTTLAYILYIIVGVIVVYIIVLLYTLRLKKSNIKLQQIVNERTDEIRRQKEVIEEKNKSITSSIEYARTIQEAILTSKEYLNAVLKNYFVFYKPRDIIGGDFYWTYKNPVTEKIVVAVGDCTGHGVPGALMSMIGNSLLNEIVIENKIEEPNIILDQLRSGIINSFQNTNISKIERSHDGMDLSLITIDLKHKILQYSCARQIIIIIRNNHIIELESDFQPVSNFISNLQPYKLHSISLQENDAIYLFTDGYPDQFGGEKGKKFMYKQFKSLLLKISEKPMQQQADLLQSELVQWMGSQEQIDDICVLGIKIE